jgi:hypothetical protein
MAGTDASRSCDHPVEEDRFRPGFRALPREVFFEGIDRLRQRVV